MTTFPFLPSEKETSGVGPERPSRRFNYKRQRIGREARMVVCVCVDVGVLEYMRVCAEKKEVGD